MTASRVLVMALILVTMSVPGLASADDPAATTTGALLADLGFSLVGDAAPQKAPIPRRGLLVPTPWGEVEATIVSTPSDRMVRVPLTPVTDSTTPHRVQPYVTAGSRLNVDTGEVLSQVKASAYGNDPGSTGTWKAGAGVLVQLDDNIELFGEYQFMRLSRDAIGTPGPLGTTLDSAGFSLGLSVRY